MRHRFTTGAGLARRDPQARLGAAMVKAEEICDGDLRFQVIMVDRKENTLRALDIRIRGQHGMTATDVSTGKTARISGRAVLALHQAAR